MPEAAAPAGAWKIEEIPGGIKAIFDVMERNSHKEKSKAMSLQLAVRRPGRQIGDNGLFVPIFIALNSDAGLRRWLIHGEFSVRDGRNEIKASGVIDYDDATQTGEFTW